MKKLLPILLILIPAIASAQAIHDRQFGVATTVPFILYNADGSLDVDEVDGGTEVSLGCDEAAESTATNDFVDEGTTYSIALTAAEMECARLAIIVAATDTNVAIVETYGDYRAQDKTRGVASGTAQASTSTTIVFESDTAIGADDILIGRVVCITEGTGVGQCRLITDYTNSSDTAEVSTWDTTPSTDSGYIVHPGNQASTAMFAAAIADAVPDESCTGHTGAGTIGEKLCSNIPTLISNDSTQSSAIAAVQTDVNDLFVFAPVSVDAVISQTQLEVDAADDPGADDMHINRWLCVRDSDDSSTKDCRRITDYDATNDRFTIASAMDFTVAIGDTLWVVPNSDYDVNVDTMNDATVYGSGTSGDKWRGTP